MEDMDRFEQLLKQRSFKSLNNEERKLSYQFVSSEEEYESLRFSDKEMKRYFEKKEELVPHIFTWKRIKESRAVKPFWMQTAVPAYTVALLLLVVGTFGWWSGAKFGSERILVEKIVPKIDTVLIASKPDTIIRERIIYLPLNPPKLVSVQQPANPAAESKGVNMKDKEELEKLLVSGTY